MSDSISGDDETEPHQWPGCPWPGWALLYARLIRDCRVLDPGLILEMHRPGQIEFDSVTTTAGDELFDRMEAARLESERTCVVCGGAAPDPGWPPLCEEHAEGHRMADSDDPLAEPELEPLLARIPERWGKSIDTGPGWYPLLVELDRQLVAIDPDYVVHQVKEKFGGLRFYYGTDRGDLSAQMDELVQAAEQRAAVTCEECGQPGTVHQNRAGWVRTLCPACAAGGGFEPIR